MEYELQIIAEGGKKAMGHAAFILKSFLNGGVFRHLENGMDKSVHSAILVDAIIALNEAGKTSDEIKSEISTPPYAIGNTSQWNQLIDGNLNWVEVIGVDEKGEKQYGKKVTFKARFGDKAPATMLTAI